MTYKIPDYELLKEMSAEELFEEGIRAINGDADDLDYHVCFVMCLDKGGNAVMSAVCNGNIVRGYIKLGQWEAARDFNNSALAMSRVYRHDFIEQFVPRWLEDYETILKNFADNCE